jgi:membrane-associated phospholipid phosphatase
VSRGIVHPDRPADPPIGASAPGRARFGVAVEAFDEAADRVLERVRGHQTIDRLMTLATDAGEFSSVWHASSLVRGLARGRPDQVIGLAIGIGAESLIVNQGLKRIFRRRRPTATGDPRYAIRTPLTSSFPSGHASAAAFAAVTLIGWDGRRWAPLWGTMATVVALSRPYVRIHHASDVVGGVVVGAAMGVAARSIFRRVGLS